MKAKYKIVLEHFNKETREMEWTETLTTHAIDIDQLESIILKEQLKNKDCCWRVKPRPKDLFKRNLK